MANYNILSLTDDDIFQLADMNLTNKIFASKFNKKKYRKIRDKYVLSLVEEQTLHRQVLHYKKMYENKKKEFENRIQKTKKYKANLVELEIKNTTLFEQDICQNINFRKNYACQLRDNKCSICHSFIYGKSTKITKLANKRNIGDWVYDRNKPNIGCKLQCGHIFHSHCITTWFNHKNQCPMCRTKIELWSSNIRSQNQNTFNIDDNSDDYSDFSDLSDITINLDEEQKEDQEPQPLATSIPSESQPAPAPTLVSSQPPLRQQLRPIRITSNTTYENIQAGIDEADSWRRERADRESEVLFPLPEQNQDEQEEIEEEAEEAEEEQQDYDSLDDFNDDEL
jgi:hypothetical protein